MLYISDLRGETLFNINKIDYDTRLNRTRNERYGSIRCYDLGSLPGGGGLDLPHKSRKAAQLRRTALVKRQS